MEFPLPNRTSLVQLHREVYYKLGPKAADMLAEMAAEMVQAHADCELWEKRAEELRSTHPQYINEDKGKIQRDLATRCSRLKVNKNE